MRKPPFNELKGRVKMSTFNAWKILVPIAVVFCVGCSDSGESDRDMAAPGVSDTESMTGTSDAASGAGTGTGGTDLDSAGTGDATTGAGTGTGGTDPGGVDSGAGAEVPTPADGSSGGTGTTGTGDATSGAGTGTGGTETENAGTGDATTGAGTGTGGTVQ